MKTITKLVLAVMLLDTLAGCATVEERRANAVSNYEKAAINWVNAKKENPTGEQVEKCDKYSARYTGASFATDALSLLFLPLIPVAIGINFAAVNARMADCMQMSGGFEKVESDAHAPTINRGVTPEGSVPDVSR